MVFSATRVKVSSVFLLLLNFALFIKHSFSTVGPFNDLAGIGSSCPARCACFGTTVDCASRGLHRFPSSLPRDAQRLDLQGNRLRAIRSSDLANLTSLRILQLHNNKINAIEDGSFRDLRALERLRLDKNYLQNIPDRIFENCPNLYKLDLSRNSLKFVGKKIFYGLSQLRYLLLDENQLSCIDENAFVGMDYLEILTLMNNNITTLWAGTFDSTPRLRGLRISGNKLICDCHLSWLGRWLAAAPHLAPYIRCASPFRLKDKFITDVLHSEFKCPGLVDKVERTCSKGSRCPRACRCGSGIVNCRDTGQRNVPQKMPQHILEARLEHNDISEIGHEAFSSYLQLKRIDLSNNRISKIVDTAFMNLLNLNSLVLYGNRITSISSNVFQGLVNLQLLFLNANQIECVDRQAFTDLTSLSLLSLYDNKIMTLKEGTFSSLVEIQTMHLGSNPFVCDCHFGWLSSYFSRRPIETTGATCKYPEILNGMPLGKLPLKALKCSSELRSKYFETCGQEDQCSASCACDGTNVDCSVRNLRFLPKNIPYIVTHLNASYNRITSLDDENGLIDLSAFDKLSVLDLSHNKLIGLPSHFFDNVSKHLKKLDLSHNSIISIEGNFWSKVSYLEQIDISHNKISCFSENILKYVPKVNVINLRGNPLRCNCHLKWFASWLKSRPGVPAPRCHTPSHLEGVVLNLLNEPLPECTAAEKMLGCVAVQLCPAKCTCSRGIVRCSRLGIREIPEGIPADTTELYLDANDIVNINSTRLNHLKALEKLDLSNNRISVLPNSTFKDFSSLATLVISFNKLSCIEKDAFVGLGSLRILSLHGNDISRLTEGTFKDLHNAHVALSSNPLYCDCGLEWLAKWVKSKYRESGIAECAEPRSMHGKLILSTHPSAFKCKEKIPQEILAKCNSCLSHPCRNGAKCRTKPGLSFECECPVGFYGPKCEHKIDACYGHPCTNGATCKIFEMGRFECHCLSGFTGERCEINQDDCKFHKCVNEGVCVDEIGSYRCACPYGFAGKYCETKIDICSLNSNPCHNGATCQQFPNGYKCSCGAGWAGKNCTTNIDDCENNLCQNGVCIDGIGSYKCKCEGEWSGKFCEMGPLAMLQQTEPCLHHDCHHGVCVVPSGKSEYSCRCLPGYSGKYCEHQTTVRFVDKGSFVQFALPDLKTRLNLTLSFSTRVANGALVYIGDRVEHLAAELFQKRLRISVDCGNKPIVMFSYEMVSDEEDHWMELILEGVEVSLKVDGGKVRRLSNEGASHTLDVDGPIFVGGMPKDVAENARSRWHLRNSTSFLGCLKEIHINGFLQDISESEKQNKVVAGCEDPRLNDQSHLISKTPFSYPMEKDKEDIFNPCKNHECKEGKCKPIKNGTEYRCRCRKGYSGKFCNKAPTCKKQVEMAYVYDYGCRSKRPLRQYRCEGSCGNQCCKPKRYRKKTVSMICNDGTKFTKSVDVVRKCRCLRKCG